MLPFRFGRSWPSLRALRKPAVSARRSGFSGSTPYRRAGRTSRKYSPMKIRVLLVDDHNIVREGLRVLLNASDEIEVVGEVADGREAVRKVQELQPGVVVMDIAMPMLNGAEATRQILRLCPEVKVLILSSYSNGEQIQWLIGAGISG
jgi:CheY-like chemotaxis protein